MLIIENEDSEMNFFPKFSSCNAYSYLEDCQILIMTLTLEKTTKFMTVILPECDGKIINHFISKIEFL